MSCWLTTRGRAAGTPGPRSWRYGRPGRPGSRSGRRTLDQRGLRRQRGVPGRARRPRLRPGGLPLDRRRLPGPGEEQPLGVADLADYLELTVSQARHQFRGSCGAAPFLPGGKSRSCRRDAALPGGFVPGQPPAVRRGHRPPGARTFPSLARLFSRPPSSILAKMANLDGSRATAAMGCAGWCHLPG